VEHRLQPIRDFHFLATPNETTIMAEAAGLAASIIAILQLSETVVGYIRETVGAPAEQKKLAHEIVSTKNVLSELESKVDKPEWKATMDCLSAPEGPLEQLKSLLKELETKLTPKNAGGKRVKVMKSLAWPFAKPKVLETLSAIERLKSLFILALQNNQQFFFALRVFANGSTLTLAVHGYMVEMDAKLTALQVGQKCIMFPLISDNLRSRNPPPRPRKPRYCQVAFPFELLVETRRYL
jgi:hypothetical protein